MRFVGGPWDGRESLMELESADALTHVVWTSAHMPRVKYVLAKKFGEGSPKVDGIYVPGRP